MKGLAAFICLMAGGVLCFAPPLYGPYPSTSSSVPGSATNVFFLNSPSITWSVSSGSNVATVSASVSNWVTSVSGLGSALTNNETRAVNFLSTVDVLSLTFGGGAASIVKQVDTLELQAESSPPVTLGSDGARVGIFASGGYFTNEVISANFIGNASGLTNIHGSNSIAAGTISTNRMDATAYAAFIGGGDGIDQLNGSGTNTTLRGLSVATSANHIGGALSNAVVINQGNTNNTWLRSESALPNSRIHMEHGSVWMPPGTFGGAGNTFGGAINWGFAGVPDWPYPQGSGGSPLGKVGVYHNWGGGASNSQSVLLLTGQILRLEESWANASLNNYISIGNEDVSGRIIINHANSYKWSTNRPYGNGIPLQFQAIFHSADAAERTYATPGIMAHAMGGVPYQSPIGGLATMGELWFYTSSPFPEGAYREYTNGIYAGIWAMKMGTNSLTVRGSIHAADLYVTNTFRIGAGSTNNQIVSGLDLSSGLQPGMLVGADNNSTARTDGTDKTFYMGLAPRTNGTIVRTIMTSSTAAGYPVINFGGGTSTMSPATELNFYAKTGSLIAENGNLQLRVADGAVQIYSRFRLSGTVTAPGTTTTQTINKPSGIVNIAAGASTLTVNSDHCTANSIVTVVVMSNDATALLKNVVPASGSFVITLNANATAETKLGFVIHDPN